MFATSGLRRNELMKLEINDVNFSKRMIIPKKPVNSSKNTWITFYNAEAEAMLKKYLASKKSSDPRLLPISSKGRVFRTMWVRAKRKSGIHITPQLLRDWFCSEMGELGVPDRYIDAFCGRVPRSILARHYTDYSPERLKRIYDKAGLRVLN
jgi:integrase